MEEQQLYPLAITHLLQHTLRSLCIHETSHWHYAVFWRILPRNFPPPKWNFQGGACDRVRGNRRNWILGWEDGFCNFTSSGIEHAGGTSSSSALYRSTGCDLHSAKGLQPDLFFKMSHEIYNYGEGLIGKVAADHGHKWVYSEPMENKINLVNAWNNPADYHPRTWEAQFQCGIKTIALIAVKEGVIQLGAVNKVMEDLSFVVQIREKFSYLESIPGVLLPHNTSSAFPVRINGCDPQLPDSWMPVSDSVAAPVAPIFKLYDQFSNQMRITPSMNSLEMLLAKLPSVGTAPPGFLQPLERYEMPVLAGTSAQRLETEEGGEEERMGKEEFNEFGAGESSSSMPYSYYDSVNKSGEGI